MRSSGFWVGNGNPLQYSCLENPMVGGTWQATVRGVAKSRTRLSDFISTFTFTAKSHGQRSVVGYIVHGITNSRTRPSDFNFTVSNGAYQVEQVVKNPAANEGDIRDVGSIPGSGRPPGGGRIPWTKESGGGGG